jgi:hypothetical protein
MADAARTNTRHRSFVRINEAKGALLTFNQIDRDKVLTTARRREPGRSSFSIVVAFRSHLFPRLIVDVDPNFLCRLRGAGGEPILVPCVEIHRDERVVMRFDNAAPMSVPDLETIV